VDSASADTLLPLVYDELRLIAARKLSDEKPGQTLQATALVHEAWLKIGANRQRPFADQKHFFSVAARAMQQILIDNARRKLTERHGAGQKPEPLEESRIAIVTSSDELLAVNDALEQLESEDPQAAEIVRLRYFVGMTVPEIATALELSPRTVDRHWAFARAWLKRAIHNARK
jgi:RNA polymerase sigma factor (TIGR02999 family)